MPRSKSSTSTARKAAAKRRPLEPELSYAVTSPYLEVYRASPLERINIIKRGVSAAEAKRITSELSVGQGTAFEALKLSPATVNRKAKRDQILSPAESERVIGIAKLVGQLQSMVQESGNPEGFEATAWMARWLKEPLPALGGRRPLDLMDTMEGQALVSTALAQMQSGAYA